MPIENDKLADDLTQLKRQQESSIRDIENLKENAEPDELADLERIEGDLWRTIIDIDEISKKRNAELQTEIETNTILYLHRPRNAETKRERCGNIVF